MNRIAAAVLLSVFAFALPALAAEKKKDAKPVEAKAAVPVEADASVPAAAPAPAPAPVLTPEELADRSRRGIENQKAWIGTLEKQLDGEKEKLKAMEADHAKNYGGGSKKAEKPAEKK